MSIARAGALVPLLCASVAAVAAPAAVIVPTIPACGAASAAAPRFCDEASRVERVLALENERLALMPAVAAWKWRHHAAVSDPARERIVIRDSAGLARPLGLEAAPVERLFELQMRLARGVESDLDRVWRAHGYRFPGPVPDLARELRPRLDRLTGALLRALYLAAPAFSRTDFAIRYGPAAGRYLRAAGWSRATRRELLADLAAIRFAAIEPAADSPGTVPSTPSVLQRIHASGVLRVGTTGDYAPFSAERAGTLTGIDIELARSLAGSIGAAPIFMRTSWPTLLDDLHRGAFDLAIGGISATPARAAAGMLSIAYLSGGKTIAARCRDASRFDSLEAVDRPGVRVVVNPGGTNEQYVRENLRRARIVVDPSNASLFDELTAGRADVVITDDAEVELQIRRNPALCRALRGTLTHADKVVLMERDPALVAAVDGWLRGEIAAGVPARLMRDALGPPRGVRGPGRR